MYTSPEKSHISLISKRKKYGPVYEILVIIANVSEV